MTTKRQMAPTVVAYWHHYITQYVHRDQGEADRWVWAWEAVDDVALNRPEEALPLIVELADACQSASALAYLGAGPVEDMVKQSDDALFSKILKHARKSARFRRALATIWIDDRARIRQLKQLFGECPPMLPDEVADDAKGP